MAQNQQGAHSTMAKRTKVLDQDELLLQLEYELEYCSGPKHRGRSIDYRSLVVGKKKRKKTKKCKIPRDEYDEGVIDKKDVPEMVQHYAIRLDNYILFFGGVRFGKYFPLNVIHTYNLDSDRWKKYEIPETEIIPPVTTYTCSAAVTPSDVYMFAGMTICGGSKMEPEWLPTNALWKLSVINVNKQNKYAWQEIPFEDKTYIPSQRCGVTAWEYDRKFWTFAGSATYPRHYKRAYGEWKHGGLDFECGDKRIKTHLCNQLNCYDPKTNIWENVKCHGTVPSPRMWAESTRIKKSVWLYGGRGGCGLNHRPSDINLGALYSLDMESVTWTNIKLKNGDPEPFSFCEHHSFTAVSESQIVLTGGQTEDPAYDCGAIKDTWIFDIPSVSWRKHEPLPHKINGFASAQGRGASVLIYGGLTSAEYRSDSNFFHIITLHHSPKRLEDLALLVIHKHKHVLKPNIYSMPNKSYKSFCNM